MLANFEYLRVTSVKEAVRQLAAGNARVHAGGTDLLGCLRDEVFSTPRIVSLSGLEELRGIQQQGSGRVRIGSLTSIAAVATHPLIIKHYPGLAQAAGNVASPQLRNQGTLGGNLCQKPRCWYYRGQFDCIRKGGDLCYAVAGENQYHCILGGDACYIVHPSDTAPALVALDATVRVVGRKRSRTVAVENFHVPPSVDPQRETVLEQDEIVADILLPAPTAGLRSTYRKVRARRAWDFALAGVALAIRFDGPQVAQVRVVLSGAAPVPWRAKAVEQWLVGRRLDSPTAAKAAAMAVQDATPLSQNGYKVDLLQGVIHEQLLAIAAS